MAAIVLAVSLLLTGIACYLTNLYVVKRNADRFHFRTTQIGERIDERMTQYEQVLRGGIGLFGASEVVDRDEWEKYVRNIEVTNYFPGIQAMGVSLALPPDELASHVKEIRAEGFEDYQVTPVGERDFYSAIVYIEPFDWRNKRAFGYDMYSHPIRREAMDRAVETGRPSISGRITLLQETDSDVQAGVLCYLPIYESESDQTSVELRRAALKGWVYAAFRIEDLLHGILSDSANDIDYRIYDTTDMSVENLMFDSRQASSPDANTAPAKHQTDFPVVVAGRQWTLHFESNPIFLSKGDTSYGWFVASIGILISILLFAVISSIGQQREVATRLAQKMTRDLQESESRMRSIVEHASEAIMTVSTDGRIAATNEASREMFDSKRVLVGTLFDDLLVNTTLSGLIEKTMAPVSKERGVAALGWRGGEEKFPCRMSVAFIDDGFIVVTRDESARVESEKEIAETHKQLLAASHSAGRAEVATGVLHNVGNVLNSVNVSASLLREYISGSPVELLAKASGVISEQEDDLGRFFTYDPRGKHFPRLLKQLAASFRKDQQIQIEEIESLSKNVDHIKEIVAMQQSFAVKGGMNEAVDPHELFEDAIKMNDTSLQRHHVEIVRDFGPTPLLLTQQHDVLQILINLIRNAQQSFGQTSEVAVKTVWLTIRAVDDVIRFEVRDNGMGIESKNFDKVFRHGFTTKRDGHGFGLHSCANAAQKMGGSLSARSEGPGKGATFTLDLPAPVGSFAASMTSS